MPIFKLQRVQKRTRSGERLESELWISPLPPLEPYTGQRWLLGSKYGLFGQLDELSSWRSRSSFDILGHDRTSGLNESTVHNNATEQQTTESRGMSTTNAGYAANGLDIHSSLFTVAFQWCASPCSYRKRTLVSLRNFAHRTHAAVRHNL